MRAWWRCSWRGTVAAAAGVDIENVASGDGSKCVVANVASIGSVGKQWVGMGEV